MKVICKLKNASDMINGVAFMPHPDGLGMVSEDIPQEVADAFVEIPGYEMVGSKAGPTQAEIDAQAAADAQAWDALNARAAVIGYSIKGNVKSLSTAERNVSDAEKAYALANPVKSPADGATSTGAEVTTTTTETTGATDTGAGAEGADGAAQTTSTTETF